jgi:hypothetical protein
MHNAGRGKTAKEKCNSRERGNIPVLIVSLDQKGKETVT